MKQYEVDREYSEVCYDTYTSDWWVKILSLTASIAIHLTGNSPCNKVFS